MNNKEKTFTLADLNENFWSTVVAAEIHSSSGLFGPGFVQLFTVTGGAYIAFYPDLGIGGWWELDRIHPLFTRDETLVGTRHPYLVERAGWAYIERERLLVRNDFLQSFMDVYAEEKEKAENHIRCADITGMVAQALGVERLECFQYRK